jgi:hypothetical protein
MLFGVYRVAVDWFVTGVEKCIVHVFTCIIFDSCRVSEETDLIKKYRLDVDVISGKN